MGCCLSKIPVETSTKEAAIKCMKKYLTNTCPAANSPGDYVWLKLSINEQYLVKEPIKQKYRAKKDRRGNLYVTTNDIEYKYLKKLSYKILMLDLKSENGFRYFNSTDINFIHNCYEEFDSCIQRKMRYSISAYAILKNWNLMNFAASLYSQNTDVNLKRTILITNDTNSINLIIKVEDTKSSINIINSAALSVNIKEKKPKIYEFIYFISDGIYFKIGKTFRRPEKRLKELQTGNSKKIHLYNYISCLVKDNVEKVLHEKFKDRKIHGEWFNISKDEVDNIIKNKSYL